MTTQQTIPTPEGCKLVVVPLNVDSGREAFAKVADHLSTAPKRAVDEAQTCMYRTESGGRCAVGALINDSDYTSLMENRGITSLIDGDAFRNNGGGGIYGAAALEVYNRKPDVQIVVDAHGINPKLLHDLQTVHDSTANWVVDVGFVAWDALLKVGLKHGIMDADLIVDRARYGMFARFRRENVITPRGAM